MANGRRPRVIRIVSPRLTSCNKEDRWVLASLVATDLIAESSSLRLTKSTKISLPAKGEIVSQEMFFPSFFNSHNYQPDPIFPHDPIFHVQLIAGRHHFRAAATVARLAGIGDAVKGASRVPTCPVFATHTVGQRYLTREVGQRNRSRFAPYFLFGRLRQCGSLIE